MKDAELKRQSAFYGRSGKRQKVQHVVEVSREEGEVEALQQKTARLERSLRKVRNDREVKYHDENAVLGIVDDQVNGTSVLCDPLQGSTVATREADEIAPIRLLLNGHIEMNTASTLTSQRIRCIILQSKEGFIPSTITATPSNSAVLSGGGLGAQAILTPYDHNNRKHFTVLMDETFTVTDQDPSVDFSRSIKISRKVRFQEAGAVLAERGQIYLCRFSTEGTNGPKMAWYSRVLYHD